jgi:hypothetical protein
MWRSYHRQGAFRYSWSAMVIKIESPKCSLVCWDAIPGPSLSELRGCGLVARCKPPRRLTHPVRKIAAVFVVGCRRW